MKRILFIFGGALLFLLLVLVAALFWRNAVAAKHNRAAFERAAEAVANGDHSLALRIVNSRPPGERDESSERRWAGLEIRACVQLGLLTRLDSLLNFHRESVIADEEACLMLARAAMHLNDTNRVALLSDAWRNKTAAAHLWLSFDADQLMLNGRPAEAEALLAQQEFNGAKDCGRLVRLAMLKANDSFADAWNLLADAYERNPRNSEVRLYRGQILERAARPRFARIEFEAAHFADTNNPIYRDTLGEFYRRQGNQLGALDVWAGDLDKETPGFIWSKALFWNRVLRGGPLPAYTVTNRANTAFAFNRYLSRIPTNQFWDEISFDLLPSKPLVQRRQQEAFWLAVIEELREGREGNALDRLRNNPFGDAIWSPELFTALVRILHQRKRGDLNPPEWELPRVTDTNAHNFIIQLDEAARKQRAMGKLYPLPDDLKKVLASDDAPALALLAAGWFRAGLDLIKTTEGADGMPGWVTYSVIQAKRLIESPEAALAYAQQQTGGGRERLLLIGELRVATGQVDTGLADLEGLSRDDSPVGFRAAWLFSTLELSRKKHDVAAAAVRRQPRLENSAIGQELLARIAMAQGQTNQAIQIYEAIVTNSVEAKAYLARLAFANSNYNRARELTEALEFELPDVMQIRANLNAIDKAEKAAP